MSAVISLSLPSLPSFCFFFHLSFCFFAVCDVIMMSAAVATSFFIVNSVTPLALEIGSDQHEIVAASWHDLAVPYPPLKFLWYMVPALTDPSQEHCFSLQSVTSTQLYIAVDQNAANQLVAVQIVPENHSQWVRAATFQVLFCLLALRLFLASCFLLLPCVHTVVVVAVVLVSFHAMLCYATLCASLSFFSFFFLQFLDALNDQTGAFSFSSLLWAASDPHYVTTQLAVASVVSALSASPSDPSFASRSTWYLVSSEGWVCFVLRSSHSKFMSLSLLFHSCYSSSCICVTYLCVLCVLCVFFVVRTEL